MPSKTEIIDNIEGYSASQLIGFIRANQITFSELLEGSMGYWPVKIRKEVEAQLTEDEPGDWKAAGNPPTKESLKRYLMNHPDGAHAKKASDMLSDILSGKQVKSPMPPPPPEEAFEDEPLAKPKRPVPPPPPPAPPVIPDIPARKAPGVPFNMPPIPDDVYDDEEQAVAEWQTIDPNDPEALRVFIDTYPNTNIARQSRSRLNELIRRRGGIDGSAFSIESLKRSMERIQSNRAVTDPDKKIFEEVMEFLRPGRLSVEKFEQAIAEDHNLFRVSVIRNLINAGVLDVAKLQSLGIPAKFIQRLQFDDDNSSLPQALPLERITRPSTEVYFWGIPSSGKTCAIGMLLSAASDGRVVHTMRTDNSCQGYNYMTRLTQLFSTNHGGVGQLPAGTGEHDFYEIGFDLIDNKDLVHPITFVDLAGELIRSMYKKDAGEALTDRQKTTLDTLDRILTDNRTKNPKIHVFVVEYGGESRLYEGLDQRSYLKGALNYLEKTKIFNQDTNMVYLMFTKADKIGPDYSIWAQTLENYVNDHYREFYQGLQNLCRQREINKGSVKRVPFTLGEVCFRDYFVPQPAAAESFVKLLVDNSTAFSESKLAKYRSALSK